MTKEHLPAAKTTFSFIIFFISLIYCYGWDTASARYYPLQTGNVYVYVYESLGPYCIPSGIGNEYRVTITGDTIMPNGKKYFMFTGWWSVSPFINWKYQRIDTATMNVYCYDTLSSTERIIDSLNSNAGNNYKSYRFNSNEPANGICHSITTQFLLGENRINKYQSAPGIISVIRMYYNLTKGIGLYSYRSCEAGYGNGYRMKGCVINGTVIGDTVLTPVFKKGTEIPKRFFTSQNFPNPFNPSTKILYELPTEGNVILSVYDITGKEIAVLVNERKPAGTYEIVFDTSGLPSGIYYYKLTSGNFSETRKMVLLK